MVDGGLWVMLLLNGDHPYLHDIAVVLFLLVGRVFGWVF